MATMMCQLRGKSPCHCLLFYKTWLVSHTLTKMTRLQLLLPHQWSTTTMNWCQKIHQFPMCMAPDIFSPWGHSGICYCHSLMSVNANMKQKFWTTVGKDPSHLQLFEGYFFTSFIKDVIISQTNKNLVEQSNNQLTYGEFLCWLGLWFLMATMICWKPSSPFSSVHFRNTTKNCSTSSLLLILLPLLLSLFSNYELFMYFCFCSFSHLYGSFNRDTFNIFELP